MALNILDTWAKAPAPLIHSNKISDGAFRLFTHIHWRAGESGGLTGWFTEALKTTAETLGVALNTVRNRINELENNNWVVVVTRANKTGRGNLSHKIRPFTKQSNCEAFRINYTPLEGEAVRAKTRIVTKICTPSNKLPPSTNCTPPLQSVEAPPLQPIAPKLDSLKPDSLNQTPFSVTRYPDQVVNFSDVKSHYDKSTKSWDSDQYIYIGRYNRGAGLQSSDWRNKKKITATVDRAGVIADYKTKILNDPELISRLPELKDKILVCWCAPEACHGDVLIELLQDMDEHVSKAKAQIEAKAKAKIEADDLFDAISWAWQNNSAGYIAKMRDFLTGKSKAGAWAEFTLSDEPMSAIEIIAFGFWRRASADSNMPTVPETVERVVLQFRGIKGYDRYLERAEEYKARILKRLADQETPEPEAPKLGDQIAPTDDTIVKDTNTNASIEEAINALNSLDDLMKTV